jgi:DNA-binding transcriptional ArsR family regulator
MTSLRVTSKPAYELLLTLVAYVTPGRVDSYAAGPEWFSDVDERLDEPTRDAVHRLFAGCEHLAVRLLDVARRLPAPGSAEALIEEVAALDPRTVRLTLLGYHAQRARQRVAPAVILAAAEGDPAAGLSVVEHVADGPECERALAGVLAMSDREAADLLVSLLRAWNERVFAPHFDRVGPLIDREADRLRGRSREVTTEDFLSEAANGADVVPAPGVEEIEVFPTWVLRPWDVFWEQDEAMLVGVGIPDREPSDDPEAPPDRLVRLARALGDERRLRILRRLLAGSFSLQELAAQLETPKTTLLHHLVILRSAGIVRVGPGPQGRYSLRPGVARELHRLLDAYLPLVPPDSGAVLNRPGTGAHVDLDDREAPPSN